MIFKCGLYTILCWVSAHIWVMLPVYHTLLCHHAAYIPYIAGSLPIFGQCSSYIILCWVSAHIWPCNLYTILCWVSAHIWAMQLIYHTLLGLCPYLDHAAYIPYFAGSLPIFGQCSSYIILCRISANIWIMQPVYHTLLSAHIWTMQPIYLILGSRSFAQYINMIKYF